MKKRLTCIALLGLATLSATACSNKETLVLYNWGEYIDNSSRDGVNLLKQFEKLHNCKVKEVFYDSNEIAVTSLETESYDIVIPSEYAIEQLAESGKLDEIDWSLVEGFTKDDVCPPLKHMLDEMLEAEDSFDFMKYAVPYFVGSVGICYNPEKVTREELDTYGWQIFKQEKFKNRVAYYDSSRDGFMPALKDLGYSMNTTSEEEINEAMGWLSEMKRAVSPTFKTDELLSEVPERVNNIDLALLYSGDAIYCMELAAEKNYDLDFYTPNSGTNIFADGMVIPKTAKNKELAYKFISFMCEKENAIANSEFVGYTTAVNAAFEEIVAEEGTYHDYKDIYGITEISEKDEIFRYNAEMKALMNSKWISFKA